MLRRAVNINPMHIQINKPEYGGYANKVSALQEPVTKPECIEPHFTSTFCLGYRELSCQLIGEGWTLPPYHSISHSFRHLGVKYPAATRAGGGKSEPGLDSLSQTNEPTAGLGEARQSGNRLSATVSPYPWSCARIAAKSRHAHAPTMTTKAAQNQY